MIDRNERTTRNLLRRAVCGYCGVKEGQLHLPGCDDERCPFCGHQLNSCDCDAYEKLGIEWPHGLTDEQSRELSRELSRLWDKLLRAKGRIPFILYPNLCAKCGVLWPEMFMVPDEAWQHYVEPRMRAEMLCKACYAQIKEWIDG